MGTVMVTSGAYRDEHFAIDFPGQKCFLDNQIMVLTRKEFELIATLACNAGEIVPREVLLQNIWGYSREIRTRTLDVHIRRLRKKLGSYGDQYIETIFGVGYRFQPYREPRSYAGFSQHLTNVA